jgi:uncharacterized protein YggT (Ycf19 family)
MQIKVLNIIILSVLSISCSYASSLPYVFASATDKLLMVLSSNLVLAIGMISIIVCFGIMFFVDLQSGGKKLLQALLGLSVILGAASFMSSLCSSGAVI